jgi:senataxin
LQAIDSRYLGHLPPETKKNFFAAVDRWQAALVMSAVAACTSDTEPTVFSLSAPMAQLLFSEPSLLSDPAIHTSLDNAITIHFSSAQPNITSSGISPLLIRLLLSPKAKRRTWAIAQLPACARRPLAFSEWCKHGVGEQVQGLYMRTGDISQADRLQGMEALLRSKVLSQDTLEQGLIAGTVDETRTGHDDRGFMSTLSHLLGSSSECKSQTAGTL